LGFFGIFWIYLGFIWDLFGIIWDYLGVFARISQTLKIKKGFNRSCMDFF